MIHRKSHWIGLWIAVVSAGCAGNADDDTGTGTTAAAATSTTADALTANAPALPSAVTDALRSPDAIPASRLDQVYSLDHFVPVGPGRRVHVSERFTLRSWLRWPHREVLMLPGTVSLGSFYNIDVDGYRFQDEMAQRGFFAFTVDYEGSGQSTYPANGLDVTHDYLVASMRPVLDYVRLVRLAPRVDVLGESNGGAVAAELCGDAVRVRSCTMSSMIYEEGTPFFLSTFLDPNFLGFLLGQPNGYLDVGPSLYFNIVANTGPDVSAWILATQPGRYAVAPLVVVQTLPWFDPTRARVPGLILQGTNDDIATQHDSDLLAADYGSARGAGGHATVVRIANAGHIPRIEPAPNNETWKGAVFEFLDGR